jgi:hydrogenase expression/formation protein HypD
VTMLEPLIQQMKEHTAALGRDVCFMEVCGTHTMAAFRTGLRSLLPPSVRLLSGPGCPVCVTAESYLDHAIAISRVPDVVLTTFGDMLRVPGTEYSLEEARARGVDVRVVYSPSDALSLARENPSRIVVFLGVGFETTTPAVAWTLKQAAADGVSNYAVLCGHKTIPGPMQALLGQGDVRVDGFLCPGHVSVIVGAKAYRPISEKHGVPCVVAGFEAEDMAQGIEMLARQLVERRAEVEIQYQRSVDWEGNAAARKVCEETMEPADAEWRGLGVIPGSGMKIRDAYSDYDAAVRFSDVEVPDSKPNKACRCGDVLRGAIVPPECPLFRKACTPSTPVGPCMVSSEGTCAAHYKYGGAT